MAKAIRETGIFKNASCQTLRHSFETGYWITALTRDEFRARRIFSWRNQLIGRTYLSTTPTIKHATQLANKVERLIQKEMMLRVFHLNHFKLRLE